MASTKDFFEPQLFGSNLFATGMFRGVGVAPGAQTLVFREMFSAHEDVTPANPRNFTTVSGLAKARRVGPRITGIDAPGWSARVRGALGLATVGLEDAFRGQWDSSGSTDFQTCGMFLAWFRLTEVNPHQVYTPLVRILRAGDFAPVVTLAAKQAVPNAVPITLGAWNGNAGFTADAEVVSAHQWFCAGLAWSYSAPTFTFRHLYMTLDGVGLVTLEEDFAFSDWRPVRIEVLSTHGVFAAVAPWSGAVGGVSAYSLDSLDDSAVYPTDLIRPVEERHVWYVNRTSGNDTNTGFATNAGWQTMGQLNTELLWGTPLGNRKGLVDSLGNLIEVASITDETTLHQLGDDIESREVDASGDTIVFLTDNEYAPGDSQTYFEHIKGLEFLLKAGVRVSSRPDITGVTWTQPSAILYPRVWKYTGTGLENSRIIEDGRLATGLTNESDQPTALTLLQIGAAGNSWFDNTGAYLVPFGEGNPNTDGVSRQIGLYLTQIGGRGMFAGSGFVIRGEAGAILDGGPTRTQAGAAQAQYCVSRTTDAISVIQNVICDGGSIHAIGMTGSGSTGVSVAIDVQYRGTFSHAASQDVEFTDAATGDIFALKRRTTQHADGGWHPDGGYIGVGTTELESWLSHGEAPETGAKFKLTLFEDCEGYRFNASRHHPNGFIFRSGVLTDIATDEAGALVDKSRFDALRVQVYDEDVTILNSIMRDTYGEAVAAYAIESGAEIDLNFTTLDTRGFEGTSDAIWSRAGGGSPRIFRLTNSAVIADGAWCKLLSGFTSADTIEIDHCAFLGHADPTILKDYNDGSTTADRTYSQCVTLGLVTDSIATTLIKLDADDSYRVKSGSPVIGVADPQASFEDYTGATFLVRNEAGAREQFIAHVCGEIIVSQTLNGTLEIEPSLSGILETNVC